MKHRSLIFLVFSLVTAGLSAGEVSLKEKMGEATFSKAGLSKLSAEELAVLEAWISGDYSEEVERATMEEYLPKGEKAFGYDQVKEKKPVPEPFREPNKIVSNIEGPFTGWDGNEIFLLENGQVWRQADSEKFYLPLDSPTVIIKKGMLGTYFLNVEGYGSRCKVRRVR